jgi:hypothetical protein
MNKSNIRYETPQRSKAIAYFAGDKGYAGARVKLSEAQEAIHQDFENFAKFVLYTRGGYATEVNGEEYPAVNISLSEAVKDYYGTDKDSFLKTLGIYKKQSLKEIAFNLGVKDHLPKGQFLDLLKQHSAHQFANAAANYPSSFNFLIPELIIDPIRVGYEGGGYHRRWIARTVSTGGRTNKISIPYIIMGDNSAKRVSEGSDVQLRTLKVDQKDRKTFKVGSGIKMTYEIMQYSPLNLLEPILNKVGVDIGISADAYLHDILINGDMAGGAESAPVIGVINTANGFTSKDIRRVTTRLKRLGYEPDVLIAGEADGLDIMDIPEFRGYSGETTQTNVQAQLLGLPPRLTVDAFKMPANQIMILSRQHAAIKVEGNGILIEEDKNIVDQTIFAVATDHITFSIMHRDARVIIDKSQTWAANTATDFPAWMNVDANTPTFTV